MNARSTVAALGLSLFTVAEARAQETTCVSVDSAGVLGLTTSRWPAISADGRVIAFVGYSSNLVAGDANRCADVFVHDRGTGVTERVSVDSSGLEANGESESPSISANGLFVAFASAASN